MALTPNQLLLVRTSTVVGEVQEEVREDYGQTTRYQEELLDVVADVERAGLPTPSSILPPQTGQEALKPKGQGHIFIKV